MEKTLEACVYRYINDDDYGEMVAYIDAMPSNISTKKELIDCILQFDIEILYRALFEKCGKLLTMEERMRLSDRYSATFNVPFPVGVD